jgi:predicted nucleic acid-binding protein
VVAAAYLLDTNVISELKRPKPHGGVLHWLRTVDSSNIFVPAVALGEMQAGVERARIQHVEKAALIEAWLDELATNFNVLPMTGAMFRIWAKLMLGRGDQIYEDAMIAATAIVEGLTVATRNARDFEGFGVPVFNPFADL